MRRAAHHLNTLYALYYFGDLHPAGQRINQHTNIASLYYNPVPNVDTLVSHNWPKPHQTFMNEWMHEPNDTIQSHCVCSLQRQKAGAQSSAG